MSIFDVFNKWRKQELSPELRKKKQKNKKKRKEAINPEKAKIIRKLKHHAKYLELEFKDVEELLSKAKAEFFAAILSYCSANPEAVNPLGPAKKEKEEEEEGEFPEELKKVYREIVKATHPDRHPEAGEEIKGIFLAATSAKEKNKLEDLINISFDLDIDISDISIELIEEIEEKLKLKEFEIQKMRRDNSIIYHHATSEQKEAFVKQVCPKKEEE
jgi:ribosomal protein L12E/L44/L45/RPP1/RPP2